MNIFKWFKRKEPKQETDKEKFQRGMDRLKTVSSQVDEKVNILEQTMRELRPNGQ